MRKFLLLIFFLFLPLVVNAEPYAPDDSIVLTVGTIDTTIYPEVKASHIDTVKFLWKRWNGSSWSAIDSVKQTKADSIYQGTFAKAIKASDGSGNEGNYMATALVFAQGKWRGIKTWGWYVDSTMGVTLADNAITADKIAPDAIGSSELATSARDEIVDQVWEEAESDHTGCSNCMANVLIHQIRQDITWLISGVKTIRYVYECSSLTDKTGYTVSTVEDKTGYSLTTQDWSTFDPSSDTVVWVDTVLYAGEAQKNTEAEIKQWVWFADSTIYFDSTGTMGSPGVLQGSVSGLTAQGIWDYNISGYYSLGYAGTYLNQLRSGSGYGELSQKYFRTGWYGLTDSVQVWDPDTTGTHVSTMIFYYTGIRMDLFKVNVH